MISTILFKTRLLSWGIGIVLSFVLSLTGNEKSIMWMLCSRYSMFVVLSSYVPVATVSLIIDTVRNSERNKMNIKRIIVMVVGFILYFSWDIAFFRGGV